MTRTAQCSCGKLRAEIGGEPEFVGACHCVECQRRTGAPFGVSAYYKKSLVTLSGATKSYTRTSDAGFEFTQHFCPDCGSTVYWEAKRWPELLGIAVGAFADPNFQKPARAVYDRSRHHWVSLGAGIERYAMGRESPPLKD